MQKMTQTQFCVPVENKPGKLYKVTQVLSREGVNLTGIDCDGLGDVAFIRFMAEKDGNIHRLLENAGFEVLESEVFRLEIPNRPGEILKVAKALGDENINILELYGTTDSGETGKIVVAVDQPEKAQPILEKWLEKAYAVH